MAYNPPLCSQGTPLRVDGEFFILQRDKMEIELKIPNIGKKTAKGKIYMTTCRIVFVSYKFDTEAFKAIDIPIVNLRKEKFEQPVFGSNYLSGEIEPLFNLLPGTTPFKLWFTAGGCDTFLRMLDTILKQCRSRQRQGQQGLDPRFVDDVRTGNISNQQAYFDPNDPSVIYITQPQDFYQPQKNNNFYGQQAGSNPYGGFQQQQQPPPQQQQQQQQYQQIPQQVPQQVAQNPQNFIAYQPQQQQPAYQAYKPQPQQQQQQPQYQQYQPQQPQFQPYVPQNLPIQQPQQQQPQYQPYVPQQQQQQQPQYQAYQPVQNQQSSNYSYPPAEQQQQQQQQYLPYQPPVQYKNVPQEQVKTTQK